MKIMTGLKQSPMKMEQSKIILLNLILDGQASAGTCTTSSGLSSIYSLKYLPPTLPLLLSLSSQNQMERLTRCTEVERFAQIFISHLYGKSINLNLELLMHSQQLSDLGQLLRYLSSLIKELLNPLPELNNSI